MDKPDIQFAPKLHPLLAILPPHLKDPRNYQKINKLIIESLASKHSHSDMVEWAGCAECQQRFAIGRREVMRKLGFKNAAQYMAWKKVMEEVLKLVKKNPILDWKTKKQLA